MSNWRRQQSNFFYKAMFLKQKGAVAKPEDKQPCKGDRTKPGVNRLKVCAAPGIDKKNNIKPCKGDRIKFVQAVFSNAPTELQG